MRIACVLVLFGIFAAVDLSAQEFPSAPKNPWRLFKGIPSLPPLAATPSASDWRGAQDRGDRVVVCGMTLVPVDPGVDPKIQAKLPAAAPRPTIRTIAPTVCR
jgi:hypothetical protein